MLIFENSQKAWHAAQNTFTVHMRPLHMRPLLYVDCLYEACKDRQHFENLNTDSKKQEIAVSGLIKDLDTKLKISYLNARFTALPSANTVALIINNFVLPTLSNTYCVITYKAYATLAYTYIVPEQLCPTPSHGEGFVWHSFGFR